MPSKNPYDEFVGGLPAQPGGAQTLSDPMGLMSIRMGRMEPHPTDPARPVYGRVGAALRQQLFGGARPGLTLPAAAQPAPDPMAAADWPTALGDDRREPAPAPPAQPPPGWPEGTDAGVPKPMHLPDAPDAHESGTAKLEEEGRKQMQEARSAEDQAGLAKLERERESWNARTKKELCGPQLRGWKVPLTAEGQRARFCTTFTSELRDLGSPDRTTRDKARTLLIHRLKNAPCKRYQPPDPFYRTCDRYLPDKTRAQYAEWRKQCADDPTCRQRRDDVTARCAAARKRLPVDDPRSDRWQAESRGWTPQQLQAKHLELQRKGWRLENGEWSHPDRPLPDCKSLYERWIEGGKNPRMWLGGKVPAPVRWGDEGEVEEDHPLFGKPKYAKDVAPRLPADRECRLKGSFTAEFERNNFYNEDGSRKSLQQLLDDGVVTRDMIVCSIPYRPRKCELKPGVSLALSKDQIDKYLKNEDGSWKTSPDGTRVQISDVVQELLDDGVISRDKVDCPDMVDPRKAYLQPATPAEAEPADERPETIRVEGSPLPYYGSFQPQGDDAVFVPSPDGGSRALAAVGGVAGFPTKVGLPYETDLPPNLHESRSTRGASSLRELTVSFPSKSESWPAFG